MNSTLRRYVFVEQPIGAFIVNFALNAAIAWAVYRGMSTVPLWGQTSIAGDTIATSFILPFLSVLIATPLVQRDIRRGKAPAEDVREHYPALRWLPEARSTRALVLGLLGLVIVAPLAVQGYSLAGVTHLTMPAFIVVKAVYAAALAAVLAPAIAMAAVAGVGAAATR